MGGRETRVNKQEDGQTGLSSRRQELYSIAVVTSSESSVGISAAPLNMSQGNERVARDNCQHREFGWSDRRCRLQSPQRHKDRTDVSRRWWEAQIWRRKPILPQHHDNPQERVER